MTDTTVEHWVAAQVAAAPPGLARRALDACAHDIAADLTVALEQERRDHTTAA